MTPSECVAPGLMPNSDDYSQELQRLKVQHARALCVGTYVGVAAALVGLAFAALWASYVI